MRPRSAYIVQAGLCVALLLATAAVLWPQTRTLQARAGNMPDLPDGPFVQAMTAEAAGKYLVKLGGCNDCHTPGFNQAGHATPESAWLTGVPVGFTGPWGTSYPSNLRLFTKDFDEETFVSVMRARNSRPPMPWPSLHAMSDRDLRAIYRYIRSLPVRGEKMPEALPPGVEPTTPYIVMVPRLPDAAPAPTTQSLASTGDKQLP